MKLSTKTISLQNPDTPIYRIFPVSDFEDVLRTRSLVLKSPSVWQDPYEDPARHVIVESMPPKPDKTAMLSKYLPPVFVQCWSKTGASDALLRAYSRVTIDPRCGRNDSPKAEGVQIRSTPRKLGNALKTCVHGRDGFKGFAGDVQYLSEAAIQQKITDDVWQRGTKAYATPELRADLLFMKRDFFSHEAEFRIVVVGPTELTGQAELTIPIDPNEVFEEATYDPRLIRFEMLERWNTARGLGYTGQIGDPSTYVGILLCAQTHCDLDDDGE